MALWLATLVVVMVSACAGSGPQAIASFEPGATMAVDAPSEIPAPAPLPPAEQWPSPSGIQQALAPALHEPAVLAQVGPYFPASVTCNTYGNVITLMAAAGAAPGRDTQYIFYRHYLFRIGSGWVTLTQPADGLFFHDQRRTVEDGIGVTPGPWTLSGLWTIQPGPGSYWIYTDYWWWTDTAWVGPAGAWSGRVRYEGSIGDDAGPCNLDYPY